MIERDRRVASPSMGRVYPLVPKRGAGLVIEDVDGNRFLDFNAGIAVTSTGHCHPQVVAAIEQQAHTLLHYCSSDWYHPIYIELCERLAAACTGARRARVPRELRHRGGGSVDQARPLRDRATERDRVPRRVPRTIARQPLAHREQGEVPLGLRRRRWPACIHAPYGESGYIERVIFNHLADPGDIAAIVVEPIQGEGGYLVPPAGWLGELRDLCTRARHRARRRRGAERSRAHRADVGRRARRHRARRAPRGQGPRQRPAARRRDRTRASSCARGVRASTARPSAGTRSRARRRWRRSTWSTGRSRANATRVGDHLQRGLVGMQRRHPQIAEVRGRGLMIGIEFESARVRARRRAGRVPSGTARAHVRRGVAAARTAARRHRSPGRSGARAARSGDRRSRAGVRGLGHPS